MASDGGSDGRMNAGRSSESSFHWVSSSPSPAEVASLEDRFPEVVQVPVAELEEEALGWQNLAVLMRTFQRWIPVEAFLREFRRAGIPGEISSLSLAFRSYIFRFTDASARDLVLQRPWTINGQIVAAEPWRPEFLPAADAISSALIWIRLPNLPIEFWREEILKEIVAPAGVFMFSDAATRAKNRGGYARACVRVELCSPLRPGTRLRGMNGPFWQSFVYEQVEGICNRCGSLHLTGCSSPMADGDDEVKAEAPLFGEWLVALRKRKERQTPMADGRWKKGSGANPAPSAPRAGSYGPAAACPPLAEEDGGTPKQGSRSFGRSGKKVGETSSGKKTSPGTVSVKGPRADKRAVLVSTVPVDEAGVLKSSDGTLNSVTESPHFLLSKNPFAALDVDIAGVSTKATREAGSGPLKRARPAEDQVPRIITRSDKKKGNSRASTSKTNQVQFLELPKLNADIGSTQVCQTGDRVAEQEISLRIRALDDMDQDLGQRSTDPAPSSVEAQVLMICSSKSSDEDERSSECLSDCAMDAVQEGSLPLIPLE